MSNVIPPSLTTISLQVGVCRGDLYKERPGLLHAALRPTQDTSWTPHANIHKNRWKTLHSSCERNEKSVREIALQTARSVEEGEDVLQVPEQSFLCSLWRSQWSKIHTAVHDGPLMGRQRLWTKPQPMEGSPQNSSLLAQAAATETPMLEQFVPEGLLPAEIHVLENLCSMGRAYAGAVEQCGDDRAEKRLTITPIPMQRTHAFLWKSDLKSNILGSTTPPFLQGYISLKRMSVLRSSI